MIFLAYKGMDHVSARLHAIVLSLFAQVFVQPHCFVLLWQGFLANLEQLSAFDYLEIRR
jgi:ACR3 family arsenite efflux pump ArsB